ncbi:hypothetical protein F66182_3667 [Fusarium sp. NRRL 66182]|nr:hypothetical protein F66182_3667 [Fusarium sp. NRRL 66182]
MSVDNGVIYAMDPPEGVARDVNQQPESAPLVIVAAIFFPLATISMIVRVYTRAVMVHKLSFDDYLMTLSWLCNVLLVAFTLNMTNYGMGKHLWNVPFTPDLYPNFSLNNVLAAIFFCAATGLAKGSILLFYLRIFPIRTARILVWVAFTFIIGYSAASVLVNIFSCHPIQGSWDPEYVPTATCINRPVFYFIQAGMGIFADIITVLIPVPWLKTLMLPKKQKIGVGILLTMGAFVIRLQSLNVLLHDADLTRESTKHTSDVTKLTTPDNTVMALMWCILELNLSIIGGSMATIKPFLRMLIPRMFSTSGGKSSKDGIYLHPVSGNSAFQKRSTRGTRLGHATDNSPTGFGYNTGSEEFIISQSSKGRPVA